VFKASCSPALGALAAQLRRGVCSQRHSGAWGLCPALPSTQIPPPAHGNMQHLLQKKVKKRMGDQGNYLTVPMTPTVLFFLLPSRGRVSRRAEMLMAQQSHPTHSKAAGLPATPETPAALDFVSCCFRPRARARPEKTPHDATE